MKSFTATIFVAAAVFLCAASFVVEVDAKFDEDVENVGLIQPPTRPWEWEGGNGKPPTPRPTPYNPTPRLRKRPRQVFGRL